MRAITGKRAPNKQAASVNTMGRFETEILTRQENLRNLSDINGKWVQKAMGKTPHQRIILDLDSSESPVHSEPEGSAYNGHFGGTCFHPLFYRSGMEGAEKRAREAARTNGISVRYALGAGGADGAGAGRSTECRLTRRWGGQWKKASQPLQPSQYRSRDRPERSGPERGGPERDFGPSR